VSFGASAPWSIGVEEELFLVDPETLDPAPVFERGLAAPPRLKPELFAAVVETATPICADAFEALDELSRLRLEAARRAEAAGARIAAIATHPLAAGGRQPIVREPRYVKMLDELGDAVYRQFVCGLHVHVGVPSAEACLHALEGVLPWLPTAISLAANSPFLEGQESGVRSARIGRLSELPAASIPPVLRTWRDWQDATAGRDYTRIWWDVRPHPNYGTIEIRVADQATSALRAAGLAALFQALVATLAETEHEPLDREEYRRLRGEAAASAPAGLGALRRLVEPAARSLGGWPLVETLLTRRPEAEAQLELGPRAALEEAVARTVVFDA
jgi:carboxylate-amine ligase